MTDEKRRKEITNMTKHTTTVPAEGARLVATRLGLPVPPWGDPLLIPPDTGAHVGAVVAAAAQAGCETSRECVRVASDDVLWMTLGPWVTETCLGAPGLSGAAVTALRRALGEATWRCPLFRREMAIGRMGQHADVHRERISGERYGLSRGGTHTITCIRGEGWEAYCPEDGSSYNLGSPANIEEAAKYAEEWIRQGNWTSGDHDSEVKAEILRHGHNTAGDHATVSLTTISVNFEQDLDVAMADAGLDPDCDHEWVADHEVVGGCEDNPGVWSGPGTTMTHTTVCRACGAIRTIIEAGYNRNPDQPTRRTEFFQCDDFIDPSDMPEAQGHTKR